MTQNRRNFLKTVGFVTITTPLPLLAQEKFSPNSILKPPRLKAGDTVGLIAPAGYIERKDIDDIKPVLAKLGLKVKLGAHVLSRYGYLAGSDANRAADVNAMFADSSVQAILPMKGGWGCNRILPLLDYSLIRSNPKIILGLSDITSLLVGIYAQSGLITFHGPTGQSSWNPFTVDYVKRVLFKGEVVTLQNIKTADSPQYRAELITAGKARGKLVGGNLSVLSAMVGSPYLPAWKDTILFLEDIGEEVYRIDRMLTQLKLAGILGQIAGFVFGQCTDCDRITRENAQKDGEQSLYLSQMLKEHIQPLGIPAWNGSMIGHIRNKFTIPIGADVEIDASKGTIQLLEPAVT
jgi:muramoyltetrapeptide carboxypeptidase